MKRKYIHFGTLKVNVFSATKPKNVTTARLNEKVNHLKNRFPPVPAKVSGGLQDTGKAPFPSSHEDTQVAGIR